MPSGYAKNDERPTIELVLNGDPYGSGFTGRQTQDQGKSWFYLGDIGAQSRDWWRRYCRINGYRLREVDYDR